MLMEAPLLKPLLEPTSMSRVTAKNSKTTTKGFTTTKVPITT